VWVPIEDVAVDGEFSFATAVLASLSRAELDRALNDGGLQESREEGKQAREKLLSKWSWQTVMRFELVAEPKRAAELALEMATDYMSLLQLYAAPAMVLRLVSHVAPRGARPYRIQDYIVCGRSSFNYEESVTERTYQLMIDAETRRFMEEAGIAVLSSLAQRTNCDYEESLLDSLLIYGRACYQVDPNDKLLQVMTAVEMFALRNDNEPIQASLADRLAFAISNDPGTRQQIAQNLRATYSARSGRTHHGKSISETETIEKFLVNAWGFFQAAIQGVGRYQTRVEFLDYLDASKYGHGTNP
jgi:hypothetical protein